MAEFVGMVNGAVEFTPSEVAAFPVREWFVGSGPPQDSLGSNNDFYLDRETADVYRKENETWA